jgi:hypothetical protein
LAQPVELALQRPVSARSAPWLLEQPQLVLHQPQQPSLPALLPALLWHPWPDRWSILLLRTLELTPIR